MGALLAFALGLPTALILTLLVRRYALARRILDVPGARSSHTVPTPRGGGLAIVVVVLAGVLIVGALSRSASRLGLAAYVGAAGAIALVSWLDDRHSLPALLRLGVHVACAALAVWAFGSWEAIQFPWIGTLDLPGWLSTLVGILWLVGLPNAYNFMDGIDGIAGSQGMVSGLAFAAFGLLRGTYGLPPETGVLVSAASIGFLALNWPPARIFMGDVGSAFLGFTFGVLGLVTARGDARMPLAAVLALAPFLFDAGVTFVRRLLAGERVLEAHRSHYYQRLVIAGHSHRSVTLVYAVLAVLCAAAGLTWLLKGDPYGGTAALGAVAVLCGLASYVRHEEQSVARTANAVTETRDTAGTLFQHK